MLKILVGSALSIVSSSLITLPSLAASNPDYGCYIQTSSKKFVDLTRSVCGFNAAQAEKDAKQDASYLATVKKVLRQDAYGSPSLNQLVETNPELITTAAREYCQARQSGKSDEEIIENTYHQLMESPEMSGSNATTSQEAERLQEQMEVKLIPTQLAMSFASQHYCPTLSSRSSQ